MRMTCDDVVQRLPWFLNGNLAPEERREVRGHLPGCAACREALGETRAAFRIFTAHVPSEALVDHAWGRSPEGPGGIDPDLIERHLEECPECAAELELARTSRQLAEEPQVALLQPRKRPEVAAPARAWKVSALAAALAGVVGLSGWIHSERERAGLESQVAAAKS